MPGLSLQILYVSECTPKDLKLYLSKLSLNPAVPAVPTGVDSCSNLLSVAVINTVTKRSFRRKRFIWLTDYSPLSREENQIRNSAKACSRNPHAGILLTGLLPGSHSIAFLIQPTTTYLGIMVLPMVSRVFLHQLSILKISPTYLPTDQHDETILQSRFHPLKRVEYQVYKKKIAHTMPLTYGPLRIHPNHTFHFIHPATLTEGGVPAPMCACPLPPGILGSSSHFSITEVTP